MLPVQLENEDGDQAKTFQESVPANGSVRSDALSFPELE